MLNIKLIEHIVGDKMKKLLLMVFLVLGFALNGYAGGIHISGNSTMRVRDVSFKDNPANYIILDEQFVSLDRWAQSGTVGLSTGVVTLTDNNSYISMDLTDLKKTYSLPINEPYIVEFTGSVATGQQLFFNIIRSTVYMVQNLIYVNTICGESDGNVGGFKCDAPANFDMTAKFKIRILIDPIEEIAQIYMYYENSSTTNPEIRETIYTGTLPFDADHAEPITQIRFTNGDVAGASTIENVRIYKPWVVGIGDSIITGQPFYWAEVPTLVDNEGCSLLKWLEKGFDDKGITINQGLGGYTTTNTEARIASMVTELKPEWAVIHIGSNDIIIDTAIATMKTNLASIVDACITENIKVLVYECQPRDDFSDAQDLVKDEWNTWLQTFTSSRSLCKLVETHDLLEDPASANNMRPMYKADADGHVNALGARILGNEAVKVMKKFY